MLVEDVLLSSSLVEVSGWDEDEFFFVEKSPLACDPSTGKLISLHHSLSDGALIFLRLLDFHASLTAIPIPYEAHFVGTDFNGLNQFSLSPANSRQPTSRYLVN